MKAKIVHASYWLPLGYLYYSNQVVTCQSFSNLLSLLSDEHPKHKSSHHKVLPKMPIHGSLLEEFCIMYCTPKLPIQPHSDTFFFNSEGFFLQRIFVFFFDCNDSLH